MKLSGRKTFLLTVVGIVLVAALGVTLYFWRAKLAVLNYRKQLIAAGEKLSVKELIPPPPAKEDDGAELFYRANALIPSSYKDLISTNPPHAMRLVAPGKAMIGWQQTELRDDKVTNSWNDLAGTLAQMTAEIQLLDQLANKKTIDFRFNYNQGFSGLLPMLMPTKRATQLLGAATIFALYEGDEESATAHIRAMLGLTRGLTDERIIISQLVRIVLAVITQETTWSFLQSTNVTDTQLAMIQKDWAALDFIVPSQHALEMERAVSEMTIGDMRESSAEFHKVIDSYGGSSGAFTFGSGNLVERGLHIGKEVMEKTAEASKEATWRVAWSYPDQLRMLKGSQVQIETARMAHSNGCFSAALALQRSRLGKLGFIGNLDEDAFAILFNDGHDLQNIFSSGVSAVEGMLHKVMAIEIRKQLVITAIALKRYQLQHGKFPANLKALCPEFLPTIPIDPVNDEPLHYKPNPDGTFLLYSVGDDGEDNGGDANPAEGKSKSNTWQRGRDWVWPQPASEQEIEDYYRQQSLKKSRE